MTDALIANLRCIAHSRGWRRRRRECFFHPRRIFRRQYVGLRAAKQRTPNANGRPQRPLERLNRLYVTFSCRKPLFSMQKRARENIASNGYLHRLPLQITHAAFFCLYTVKMSTNSRIISMLKFTSITRRLYVYRVPVTVILDID